MTTTASLRRAVTVSTSALLLASAAGCGGSADSSLHPDNPGGVVISGVQQNGPYHGAEPARPYSMPDVTLTATNDRPFNLIHDTAYPVTLVFFGYTNCPDVCPLVMSDLTSTYLHLPKTLRSETQVLFITTDPARDSLSTLRGYLGRYDSDFVGLTGSLHDIVAAAEGMGVAISGRHKLASGGYDVGHGAQVIGFHGETAPVIWTGGTIGNVGAMVSDISRLAGS